MVLTTILIFVGMLLALVLVHEWGHFIVGKKEGLTVALAPGMVIV